MRNEMEKLDTKAEATQGKLGDGGIFIEKR
jgi:hypothetical protein